MRRFLFPFAWTLSALTASAITISIDYTYDSTSFFSTYTDARDALEQAANDVGSVINSSLGAISTDVFVGTSGSTSATLDWSMNFTNPTTGGAESLTTFTAAADTIVLYAGARPLTGTTLGQGGPGSAGLGLGASGFGAEWEAAMDAAVALSNASMLRGGDAPVLNRFNSSFEFDGVTANYNAPYAPVIGNIWFDSDTDNDTFVDNEATLLSSWHFDHTTSVGGGLNDFYSVALHEVLHGIGFGTSETWNNLVDGTTWLGTEAATLNGTGTNLVTGGHIASGIFSTRLSDDGAQEVVMDPSITTGTRKTLTDLDVAFLADLNYSVSAVPEPANVAGGLGLLALLGAWLDRRRRRRQV